MVKKIAISVISFIFVLLIIVLLYFNAPIKTKHNIKLPSSNAGEIVHYLNKEGYGVTFLDKLFLKLAPQKPIKGWIHFNKTKLPRYQFLLALTRKVNFYIPVTVIPGETTYFVLNNISKKLDLNRTLLKEELNKQAFYKEGNFLADTYNIPIYFKEKDVIKLIISSSIKRYKNISMQYFGNFSKKDFKKILIIASIIEKEAGNRKEMPLIASVIFNRLHKNMRLQMDGTLNYGIYSHSKITPKRIKGDRSSYNTYKFKGLPKEPVCNVSIDAILAAIKPAKTEYLYFMKNGPHSHKFSKEYKEHIKNIKERKRELRRED